MMKNVGKGKLESRGDADEKENQFNYYLPDNVRQYNRKFYCICTGRLPDDNGRL